MCDYIGQQWHTTSGFLNISCVRYTQQVSQMLGSASLQSNMF